MEAAVGGTAEAIAQQKQRDAARQAEREEEKRLRREESEALAAVHARLNVSRRDTLSHASELHSATIILCSLASGLHSATMLSASVGDRRRCGRARRTSRPR